MNLNSTSSSSWKPGKETDDANKKMIVARKDTIMRLSGETRTMCIQGIGEETGDRTGLA